MAKRGPGKFDSDLDAALYEMSTEGADAEIGSSSEPPYLWAGLLKSGADIARAIEYVHASGEPGYKGVDAKDLTFLRTKGKAGVIITENDQGFVETVFYEDNDKLWKDWEELEQELSEHEDEEFEENSRPRRRRNSKLRDVSSRYGAPMGRHSEPISGNVTLEHVRLDTGGYDNGGAYWGTGEPLWRAQDEDGNEQFIRAKDRKAAEGKLTEKFGDEIKIVRSTERQSEGEDSKLETDGTLAELLDMQAESNELPSEYRRELEVTPELSQTAREYENALWTALSQLVTEIPPNGDADANVLMEDGSAPFNVYATLAGMGVGINDGRWDEYYDADVIENKVRPFLEARLGRWVSEFGSGKLNTALDNAVFENEERLGIKRDDEGHIIERDEDDEDEEREENRRPRHRRNGSQPWIVTLKGEQTDIVYFADDMSADDVKRALVDHDGYDPRIVVKKRERRRTHAPDALAENSSGGPTYTAREARDMYDLAWARVASMRESPRKKTLKQRLQTALMSHGAGGYQKAYRIAREVHAAAE